MDWIPLQRRRKTKRYSGTGREIDGEGREEENGWMVGRVRIVIISLVQAALWALHIFRFGHAGGAGGGGGGVI